MKRLGWLWVAMALWLIAGSASADDAAEKFQQAQKLFLENRFAEALPLFRDALVQSGSPNARLYVARCLDELGESVDAYREMSQTLGDASADPEKYGETRDSAAKELAALEAKIGKLIIRVENERPGQEVTLDGNSVDMALLGTPIVVARGHHRVVATAAGSDDVEKDAEIAAGQSLEVTLRFVEPEVVEPPEPDSSPSGAFWTPLRIAGVATGGVGVAGMVAFAVTAVMVKKKESTLEDECGGHCTDPKYDEVIDDGKTLQLVANVSLGVGAGLLLAGGAMFLLGAPDEEEAQSAILVSPTIGGVVIAGSF